MCMCVFKLLTISQCIFWNDNKLFASTMKAITE